MDNYIFCRKKALDRKTCDHIINVFEKSNPEWEKTRKNYYLVIGKLDTIKFNFLLYFINVGHNYQNI